MTHITELVGLEGDQVTMQDIFLFEKTGVAENGKVLGRFKATGVRPRFYEKLKASRHPAARLRCSRPWWRSGQIMTCVP